MNILHITPDHSTNSFGVTTLVSQLADQLAISGNNINIYICAVGVNAVEQNEMVDIILLPPSRIGRFWRWSHRLPKNLENIIEKGNIDIIHVHGIWLAAHWAGLKLAKERNLPVVLSPHGMLEEWLWNEQGFTKKLKKNIYFNLVFKSVLSGKVFIHAITKSEESYLRTLFPEHKIYLIPNAINLAKTRDNFRTDLTSYKHVLFLGRLHPKKGVGLLIQSFANMDDQQDCELVIAGPEGFPGYATKLERLASNLGLENKVKFIGPIFDSEKWNTLRKSWVLVTPSHSEVVGMVNLEAAICRLPAITTYETGLLDWEDGGGLLVHPNTDDLTTALKEALSWTIEERQNRGEQSYRLVQDRYSWRVVLGKWQRLYQDLLS